MSTTRRFIIKHTNGFDFGFSLVWGLFFGAVSLVLFLGVLATLFGFNLTKYLK